MKTKTLIVIASIVLGVLAAVAAGRYLESARARLQAQAEPVKVLVAVTEVPKGTSAEDLMKKGLAEVRSVPRQYVAASAVSSVDAIAGQVLVQPLAPGEQVTTTRFQYAESVGLAFSIPEGHVAVAIPADDVKCVGGLIRPGDFVMVTASFDESKGLREAQTRVLLPRVRVLAVGRDLTGSQEASSEREGRGIVGSTGGDRSASANSASTITLALVPEDVEKLVHAERQGTVWLALIPNGMAEVPSTPGRTLQTLYR